MGGGHGKEPEGKKMNGKDKKQKGESRDQKFSQSCRESSWQ